jgi:hypothetical protein
MTKKWKRKVVRAGVIGGVVGLFIYLAKFSMANDTDINNSSARPPISEAGTVHSSHGRLFSV